MKYPVFVALMIATPAAAPVLNAEEIVLLADFPPGWQKEWEMRVLADRSNENIVVREENNPALKMISSSSASGFWRKWEIEPVVPGTVSWRWKVTRSLPAGSDEREKDGDDYAARVFVIFEPHLFRWKTRSICYVWAGREPAGSVFPNPFSDRVGTIVLESGNEKAGSWVWEERNYFDDYRAYFGEDPERISGVAVMADTDNTGTSTTAWFDDLALRYDSGRR